jgi:hypothetical protein
MFDRRAFSRLWERQIEYRRLGTDPHDAVQLSESLHKLGGDLDEP